MERLAGGGAGDVREVTPVRRNRHTGAHARVERGGGHLDHRAPHGLGRGRLHGRSRHEPAAERGDDHGRPRRPLLPARGRSRRCWCRQVGLGVLDPLLQGDAGVADGLEAPGLVLLQAAPDEVLDPPGHVRGELVELGLLVDDGPEHVGDRLPVEGLAAPQHLEEHAPEGPDVGAPVHRLAPGLLGRHVPGRPQEHPGLGPAGGEGGGLGPVLPRASRERVDAHGLGQAEVEDLDLAVLGDHDVSGLEVAVDDALLVGDLEGLGDLGGDLHRVGDGDGAPGDALGEGLALGDLHDQEALAVHVLDAVDAGDVGVGQRGEDLGLAVEALEALGVLGEALGKDLEGHVAAELGVLGAPDLAHPALAQLRGHLVVGNRLADHVSQLLDGRKARVWTRARAPGESSAL